MSDQHGGHPQQGGWPQQPQQPQQGQQGGWQQQPQQPQHGGWQQHPQQPQQGGWPQQGQQQGGWQQGGYPPPQQGGWQQGYPPQGYPGYPPAQPKVNPFLGVPVGDFIRDGVALVALFSTLAMPWNLATENDSVFQDASDRWWVIIAVLISVASLAVPYVVKSGAIPGWGPSQARLLKIGLNVPAFLAVFGAVVLELIKVGDDGVFGFFIGGEGGSVTSSPSFEGGIGTGVAMLLAGSLLAITPRAYDDDPSGRSDSTWRLVTQIVVFVGPALSVLGFILFAVDVDAFDPFLIFLAMLMLLVVVPLISLVWPAVEMVGGKVSGRRVLATVACTVLVCALFGSNADFDDDPFFLANPAVIPVSKWNEPLFGFFLIGAAGALAVAIPLQRATARREDEVSGWISTAKSALLVAAGLQVAWLLSLLFEGIENDLEGPAIVSMILMALSAGAAVAVQTFCSDVRKNQMLILIGLGVYVLLSIVVISILNSEDLVVGLDGWLASALFVLPGLAAYSLLVPPAVRSAFPVSFGSRQQGHPQGYGPPPGYPQHGGYPPQGGYPQQGQPGQQQGGQPGQQQGWPQQ